MTASFRRALLCGGLCALFCLNTPAQALSTSAASALLMDAQSGRVLYSHDANQTRSIASITKLMTALVAAERTDDLAAPVLVDPAAVGVEGSSIYLASGEELTMEQLLYGLLLQSGNDAAAAIAIACAGDVDTFARWMNDKAAELGMAHSHFDNPSGLESDTHYSTAYDMALLARAVLAHPVLARIVSTKHYSFGVRTLTNHNKLLWRYEGCVGLKTGYTQKAGRTLVSAATRGQTTLIAVTLHDPDDWTDHAALLDYGFQGWTSQLLARPGRCLATLPVAGSLVRALPVVTAQEVRYPLADQEQPTARFQLPLSLKAPVDQGDVVGTLTFYLNGEEIGRTDLLAAASAPQNSSLALMGISQIFYPLVHHLTLESR